MNRVRQVLSQPLLVVSAERLQIPRLWNNNSEAVCLLDLRGQAPEWQRILDPTGGLEFWVFSGFEQLSFGQTVTSETSIGTVATAHRHFFHDAGICQTCWRRRWYKVPLRNIKFEQTYTGSAFKVESRCNWPWRLAVLS